MIIGGYHPLTLCDYPGVVASVVFTQGCNFCCPYCHNGDLIPHEPDTETMVSEQYVLDHLSERRLHLQGVVISGGEPTLQPDLAGFIRRAREFGMKIKLDTNGSRPEVLEALLDEGLLDFVAMDVKTLPDRYAVVAGVEVKQETILRSVELVAESGVEHMFRTTRVPELISLEDMCRIRQFLPRGSFHTEQVFLRENAHDARLREVESAEVSQTDSVVTVPSV